MQTQNTTHIWQALALVVALCGCETVPSDAFRLSESALQVRELQTRDYYAIEDANILSASMAVLQDMGYAIDEVEAELGVLSASKRADATNDLVVFGSIAADTVKCLFTLGLGCTGGNYADIDDVQDIRLTLVTRPLNDHEDSVAVRVTIQRIIWSKKGAITAQETITEPDVYIAFFDKLSTAVFLEQEEV